jgi:hypothetical protein
MVAALKITIDHPDILNSYSKLIEAYASKQSSSQALITTEMEKILAKTVFRGTTVASGAGQSNPDFLITNDGLNALLSKVSSSQEDMDKFNQFIQQTYGQAGNLVETKIMRSQGDHDIKIGTFTPNLTNDNIRYFDFVSGDIIDTTKYSVVQALRESYQGDSAAQAPSQKELKPKLKRSDLQSFIRTTSSEFQKLVMSDNNVRALDKLLAANPQQQISSAQVSSLVDKINQKWAKSSLESELTRLTQKGTLFDYILSVPALKSQFYNKSRLLSIIRNQNGQQANALLLYFSLNDFTNKYFGAKYDEGKIKVFIKSEVEKIFLDQLSSETASLKVGQNMDDYDKAVKELISTGTLKNIKITSLNMEISYLVPTGGSIPMSSGNFFGVNRLYKRSPYIKSGDEKLAKFSSVAEAPIGTFLSSEYLSLLVRQKVVREMPHGPIGGKPLSHEMLTYRTGRFANSIQLQINYKERLIRYYYNPIYYVHEVTSRDPRKLIESNINEVVRERFKQRFSISESHGVF